MTASASSRPSRALSGPMPARLTDIDPLNRVFSDAFTERYRRDGLAGVRVPSLNPAIWRYAIEDADGGAMLWRDERDDIVAFNVAHHSGVEGWMGPLAVRPEWQGRGVGRTIVRAGVDWLTARRSSVIGLETMPRTMDNIGFYSSLGFLPGRLTITLTLDASTVDRPALLLGRLAQRDRDDMLAASLRLTREQLPGYDFTRELLLTLELGLGDVVMLMKDGLPRGFVAKGFRIKRPREYVQGLPPPASLPCDLSSTVFLCDASDVETNERLKVPGDVPGRRGNQNMPRFVRIGTLNLYNSRIVLTRRPVCIFKQLQFVTGRSLGR